MASDFEIKDGPLIPLEYCSLERASRLLGCEVEDILHWASIGAIKIYAQFKDSPYSDGDIVHVGEIYLDYDLLTEQEYKTYDIEHEGILYKKKIPIGERGPIHECNNVLSVDSEQFYLGSGMILYDLTEGLIDRDVTLWGFWEIDISSISNMLLLGGNRECDPWNLRATYIAGEGGGEQSLGLELYGVNFGDISSRLRIIRDDILKMKMHINNGELMGKTPKPVVAISEERRGKTNPHPTAERHAATRERVYAAAIYAREKWPDECRTATAWADVLVNHSSILFKSENPPLSHDSMARLLSKAMNEGVPYRKG